MSLAAQLSLYLTILVLTNIAEAGLPWDSQISHPVLKTADIVAFDPLTFLAIFPNPLASTSAVRLYMQSGKKTFRWPYMMQIGAVNASVKLLVNYLTSNYSKHPGLVVSGTIFSALLGDIWAIVLFATYLFYWLASTAISFRQLVILDRLKIQDDEAIVFAVYGYPSGGLIIFKGTKAILEQWARTKWVFSSNRFDTFAYWIWIITGTAAAFASQACMVNMSGYLQLGFLGMLFYSSAAELWLTVLSNELPTDTFHRSFSTKMVGQNDKRYKSIIQASLGLDRAHRLNELRWIDLGLLPNMDVFSAMVITLDYLNNLDNGPVIPNLAEAKEIFLKERGTIPEKDTLTRGIWDEIERVWMRRQSEPQMLQVHHV